MTTQSILRQQYELKRLLDLKNHFITEILKERKRGRNKFKDCKETLKTLIRNCKEDSPKFRLYVQAVKYEYKKEYYRIKYLEAILKKNLKNVFKYKKLISSNHNNFITYSLGTELNNEYFRAACKIAKKQTSNIDGNLNNFFIVLSGLQKLGQPRYWS
jgi:hypothetical protein